MAKLIAIILTTVAVVLLVVGARNFIKARQTTASNAYVNDLRQLDGAKQQWALENGKTTNDTPTWPELLPYFGGEMTNFFATNGVVMRPAGGVFTIGRVGEPPSCVVNGKRVNYP
jgi:hypothetical protein